VRRITGSGALPFSPFKEKCHINRKEFGEMVQNASTDSISSFLIFLHLLKRDFEFGSNFLLRHPA